MARILPRFQMARILSHIHHYHHLHTSLIIIRSSTPISVVSDRIHPSLYLFIISVIMARIKTTLTRSQLAFRRARGAVRTCNVKKLHEYKIDVKKKRKAAIPCKRKQEDIDEEWLPKEKERKTKWCKHGPKRLCVNWSFVVLMYLTQTLLVVLHTLSLSLSPSTTRRLIKYCSQVL